jgi:peptidyl-prolyl cis-trans isomerase C
MKMLRGGARAALRARALGFVVPLLSLTALQGQAQELSVDTVVAERGGVALTVGEVDAKIRSMPPEMRGGFMADPQRMGEMIDKMLLTEQVAAQAQKEGLQNDPDLLADLELVRIEMLAARQIQRNTQRTAIPNFELLAHERYLSDPGKHAPAPRIDLRHVLVSTDGHLEAESKALSEEIFKRAKAGEDLSELADEYIEKKGDWVSTQLLERADASRFDNNFVAAMSVLEKQGDLAGPVRSKYGWHVIRLEKYETYPPPPYEEVKAKLVEELRGKYLSDERTRYLSSLTHDETRLVHEVIGQLPARYAGQAQAEARQAQAQPPR